MKIKGYEKSESFEAEEAILYCPIEDEEWKKDRKPHPQYEWLYNKI